VRDNALTVAIPRDELPEGGLGYILRTRVGADELEQPPAPVVSGIVTPELPDVPEANATPSTTTTPPERETVADFYTVFAEAVRSGDVDTLLARLHPIVLDAYPDTCPDVLATFADPEFDVTATSDGGVTPWTWSLPDGRSFDVADATTVTIELSGRGQTGDPVDSHLAAVDGEYRWFTYC
jgi:hypothetical protein